MLFLTDDGTSEPGERCFDDDMMGSRRSTAQDHLNGINKPWSGWGEGAS